MADEVARLVAVMEANLKGFTKGMEQAQVIADKRLGAVEARLKRTEGAFAGSFKGAAGFNTAIGGLIARYTSWSAILVATQRIVRQSIEVNDEASASWERLQKTLDDLAFTAGPAVAGFFDGLSEILKRDIKDVEKLTALYERLKTLAGVIPPVRTSGVPFANAEPTFAGFDKKTGTWTPTIHGFPATGVTDITPKKEAGKTFAERQAELDIETMNKVADAVQEIQQKRAKEDLDFRAQQFEAQREQQNAAKAEELDALDQFFNDAQDAEDRYWENITAMAVAADELQAERVKDRISEIGDAFEYLGQAALEGGEAFERALANMARSLAVSGLRSILEGFLTSRVGGGGLFANLISPRASGGPVQAGRPYLVGEQRPELFVPNTSGTIIPRIPNMTANDKAWGGMSITLQQNMTLAANGDAQVARIAEDAASRGAAVAIKTIQRQFPALMIKSQRDRL